MFGRKRPPAEEPKEAKVKPEEVVHEGSGKVIQRTETLEGGYKCGSTTHIHLAVRQEDGTVIAFRGSSSFAQLPLAQVGDTVKFTYQSKGWIDLKGFEVDFAKREAAR